ncbi:MAG: hypothetical protein ACYDAQ_07270, partial [Mycobacteriales bacterium]
MSLRPAGAVAGAVAGVVAGAVAGVVAGVAPGALDAYLAGPRWVAPNYRGDPVRLSTGPAAPAAVLLGLVAGRAPRRVLLAAAVAGGVGALAGRLDDLAGPGQPKGLRGHLAALRSGRPTTGAGKLVALGSAGPLAAWIVRADPVADGALVAAAAHVVNLLDVRPGRAWKGILVLAATAAGPGGAVLAASLAGAALGSLPADLAERRMLGDCGANAAGALAGLACVLGLSPAARRAVLLALALLTGIAEVSSLSAGIEAV